MSLVFNSSQSIDNFKFISFFSLSHFSFMMVYPSTILLCAILCFYSTFFISFSASYFYSTRFIFIFSFIAYFAFFLSDITEQFFFFFAKLFLTSSFFSNSPFFICFPLWYLYFPTLWICSKQPSQNTCCLQSKHWISAGEISQDWQVIFFIWSEEKYSYFLLEQRWWKA